MTQPTIAPGHPTSAIAARPAFIVHGGAWGIPDAEVEDHRAGVRAAAELGWDVLARGGSAMDAVEAAITRMEDDPTFDAGRGSHLNRNGQVELDAGMMEGMELRAGAVACVRRLRHPIRAARLILEAGDHILFVGEGAEAYAAEKGLDLIDNAELVIPREQARFEAMRSEALKLATPDPFRERHFGTVGAVALDAAGALVAGTSTGGSLYKRPGRVGDSPLVGGGYYADVGTAGVSTTGWGESILRIQLAKRACDLVERGAVGPEAAVRAIEELGARVGGWGGLILIDRAGWIGLPITRPAWPSRGARRSWRPWRRGSKPGADPFFRPHRRNPAEFLDLKFTLYRAAAAAPAPHG